MAVREVTLGQALAAPKQCRSLGLCSADVREVSVLFLFVHSRSHRDPFVQSIADLDRPREDNQFLRE
jgi:hypothetical protein